MNAINKDGYEIKFLSQEEKDRVQKLLLQYLLYKEGINTEFISQRYINFMSKFEIKFIYELIHEIDFCIPSLLNLAIYNQLLQWAK